MKRKKPTKQPTPHAPIPWGTIIDGTIYRCEVPHGWRQEMGRKRKPDVASEIVDAIIGPGDFAVVHRRQGPSIARCIRTMIRRAEKAKMDEALRIIRERENSTPNIHARATCGDIATDLKGYWGIK